MNRICIYGLQSIMKLHVGYTSTCTCVTPGPVGPGVLIVGQGVLMVDQVVYTDQKVVYQCGKLLAMQVAILYSEH